MPRLTVTLNIPPDEFQRLYLGVAEVVALAEDGRRVRFPARILRPFVGHHGIMGRFAIDFDAQYRYQGIERLPPP